MWWDVARCFKILRSLCTKFKVVIEITFLLNTGGKVWKGVLKRDKIWEDVTTFQQAWLLNLKLSFTLLFYQRCGIKCGKVW